MRTMSPKMMMMTSRSSLEGGDQDNHHGQAFLKHVIFLKSFFSVTEQMKTKLFFPIYLSSEEFYAEVKYSNKYNRPQNIGDMNKFS